MTFQKANNKKTGDEGENIAVVYLSENGYKILERNIRSKFGEIDILARYHNTIVIVEVKTVKGTLFGPAQDLVRYNKQKKLLLLGTWIQSKYIGCSIRIDVIAVDLSENYPKIEHFKNAIFG